MKKIWPLLIIITITNLLTSYTHGKENIECERKNTNGFNMVMNQFAHNITTLWGMNEVLIAGTKDYVKYTDHYETRYQIKFDTGAITIETIVGDNPGKYLRQAIVNTILMGNDPVSIDFYSDAEVIPSSQKPFIYGQMLDNDGQPIRIKWRAATFADYMLQTRLKTSTNGLRQKWSVTIPLVLNHVDKRSNKYRGIVRKASQQYGVDQSLILAIMQTESSFNPYAVSNADALGLMQVVQHSAGRDVFKMKGKRGQPSRSYLLNPGNNIDTGTAYLAMLQKSYLGGIVNPMSRRYAVITAYNGGAGSVLRVFASNQNLAFQIINGMQPEQVYQTLSTQHPSAESRLYLSKVNNLQKNYCHCQQHTITHAVSSP
ncbi:Membrane-bound lytic murein transglycosylase C [Candidatus Moranella endobia PCVAL]|uniref:membrane-bound lytic murein transglycosylase MltC n=1 Tax=Candidatus Moranella endobia TaxID=1048758 RepID=UPI0002C6C68F|nr:membrane-bound lytic murein transglycosylase MltC [Candidatus Moranella endobia]AGJ61204.1 Membrane-bound lytic murein transglycosylase C [Candidatus Moranella endobia PCVAL]